MKCHNEGQFLAEILTLKAPKKNASENVVC